MRKFLLVVCGPMALLAATALVACETETSDGPGPSFGVDGSTSPFDGSGLDSATPSDGSAPDAAAAGQVTVRISDRSGPRASVRVVFHDASGAVLETKLTGADGKATSSGALPAMASALVARGTDRDIVTWTGLEAGDELALRELVPGSLLGQYDVTLPGPFGGATSYDVRAGDCSAFTEGTSALLDLYPGCVSQQGAVLARASDLAGATLAHAFKKGATYPTDGGALAVAMGAWQTPTNVTVNATGLGPSGADAELVEIADGIGFRSFEQTLEESSTAFATATGFSDAHQASLLLYPQPGAKQIVARRAAPAATIALDAAQALPPITATAISGGSARRPVLTWTSSSTAAADGGLVRVRFFGPQDASYHWTFVIPPGATTVTAPAMPDEANAFLPTAIDGGPTDFESPEVVFVESDVIPSYAVFRRQQGTLIGLETSFAGFSLPAMPMNGTYRATAFATPLDL